MHDPFKNGRDVLREIEAHGYEAYFVGGCVRDYLTRRQIKDIDITTSAAPDIIESIFDKTIAVGKVHGTIIVIAGGEHIEVTTYRTETTYSDFRRPDEVSFTSSLEEDLKRRDFTVNAIAMRADMTVIDPNNGDKDIKRRVIQTVGDAQERFTEDALRMLRALRFSVQLQFDISDDTFMAIKRHAHLIEHVSMERIIIEIKKMYESGRMFEYKPSIAASGILSYVPLMNTMDLTLFKSIKSHSLNEELAVQLYFNHVKAAALKQLKLSNEDLSNIKQLHALMQATRKKYPDARLLAYNYSQEMLNHCTDLIKENREYLHKVNLELIEEARDARPSLTIYKAADLAINGHDILQITNRPPGRWMRDVIQSLEKQVLLGELDNTKESLENWVKTHEDNT